MSYYKELGNKLNEHHDKQDERIKSIEQLLEDIKTEELNANNTHPVTNKIVYEAIEALKKSVSDGKKMIANAITSKGIDTAINESFQSMAVNIYNIGRQEIGIDIFYFPIDVEDSITVPHIYNAVDVMPVYGDYIDVRLASIHTGRINTDPSIVCQHIYPLTEIQPVIDDTDCRNINPYHVFNDIIAEEALIIPWSNRSVTISNEREEY